MQPPLPIEVVEWILDLILEETFGAEWRGILAECALVCRAWVPYCQSHQFREQRLFFPESPRRVYRMRQRFRAAPHLCIYVRRFKIYESNWSIGYSIYYTIFLTVLAPLLPSLQHLELYWGARAIHPHRFFRATPFKALNITSFTFDTVALTEGSSLYGMISLFPNLRVLTLDGIIWLLPDESIAASTPSLRPRQIALVPPIVRLAVATETLTTLETQVRGLVTALNPNLYSKSSLARRHTLNWMG